MAIPSPGHNTPLEQYRTLFRQKGDSKELLERLRKKQSVRDIVMTEGRSLKRKLSKRIRKSWNAR